MKATDYRMIAFEGDLDDITRKINAWASGDDGIEIVNIRCISRTFDTYTNCHAVIVFYKKEIYKVEKLTSGKCKPAVQDTVEYAGDGNTTWRTETKEDKND